MGMTVPPILAGGEKVTITSPLPAVALTFVGAPGFGVTGLDGADGALVPAALLAVTVQATAWPLLRPDTITGEEGAPGVPGRGIVLKPQVAL